MKIAWIVAGTLTLAFALPAGASGPYDGDWTGSNCYEAAITMKIADGNVAGNMNVGRQTFNFKGVIAADGAFNGGWLTGQFNGASFTGNYTRQGGSTASDAGRLCRVVAQRSK